MFTMSNTKRHLERTFSFIIPDRTTRQTSAAAEQTIDPIVNLEKAFAYFEYLQVKTEEERIIEFKDAFQSGYLGALCMELYNKRDCGNPILENRTISTCLFFNWLSKNEKEIAAGFSHFCNHTIYCCEGYKIANDFVGLLKMQGQGSDLGAIQNEIKNFINYIWDYANIDLWEKEPLEQYRSQNVMQESMEEFLLVLMPALNKRILFDFYNAIIFNSEYVKPRDVKLDSPCYQIDSPCSQNVNQVIPMPGSM
jgi:hypothetical protein